MTEDNFKNLIEQGSKMTPPEETKEILKWMEETGEFDDEIDEDYYEYQ